MNRIKPLPLYRYAHTNLFSFNHHRQLKLTLSFHLSSKPIHCNVTVNIRPRVPMRYKNLPLEKNKNRSFN